MNELLKLMFCLAVVASAKGTGTVSHLALVVKRSGLMVIPAVVYLVVNLISYPSLERINASVFTAISQLKVLATALFAMLMLRTSVSARKWRTLMVMVTGVTLISWESAPEMSQVAHSHNSFSQVVSLDYLVGIMCAAIQTMLSGFGAIFFEKILKSKSGKGLEEFSVWDRNIQLAIYSIIIYLPAACYETGWQILSGWTALVWLIAFLHAAGGILVALSVLYSNSITKTVAVCGSLVFTTILGNVFFDAPFNGPILLGCIIVIMSIFGYRDDCHVEEQLREARMALSTHIPR